MILNSMLQNSPVAVVVAPLVALVAYGIAAALGACGRWLRRPRLRGR